MFTKKYLNLFIIIFSSLISGCSNHNAGHGKVSIIKILAAHRETNKPLSAKYYWYTQYKKDTATWSKAVAYCRAHNEMHIDGCNTVIDVRNEVEYE